MSTETNLPDLSGLTVEQLAELKARADEKITAMRHELIPRLIAEFEENARKLGFRDGREMLSRGMGKRRGRARQTRNGRERDEQHA